MVGRAGDANSIVKECVVWWEVGCRNRKNVEATESDFAESAGAHNKVSCGITSRMPERGRVGW